MSAKRKSRCGLGRIPVRIEEIPTGGRSFQLVAHNRFGEDVGWLEAYPTKMGGRKVFVVDTIEVTEEVRRQGVATQLYEAAARLACSKRSVLGSQDRLQGAWSNEFWEKQLAKGRAIQLKPKTGPVTRGTTRYMLTSCESFDLSGLRKRRR